MDLAALKTVRCLLLHAVVWIVSMIVDHWMFRIFEWFLWQNYMDICGCSMFCCSVCLVMLGWCSKASRMATWQKWKRQVRKSFVFKLWGGFSWVILRLLRLEQRLVSGCTGWIERMDSAYSAFRRSIGLDKDWYRNLGSGHDEAFDGPALLILGDNMPPEEADAIIDSNALQLGNLVDAFWIVFLSSGSVLWCYWHGLLQSSRSLCCKVLHWLGSRWRHWVWIQLHVAWPYFYTCSILFRLLIGFHATLIAVTVDFTPWITTLLLVICHTIQFMTWLCGLGFLRS